MRKTKINCDSSVSLKIFTIKAKRRLISTLMILPKKKIPVEINNRRKLNEKNFEGRYMSGGDL
jgi:hypothetical protein